MCQPPRKCWRILGPSRKHNKFKLRPLPPSVSAEVISDIHPTIHLHSSWLLPQIQVTTPIYYAHSLVFMLLLIFYLLWSNHLLLFLYIQNLSPDGSCSYLPQTPSSTTSGNRLALPIGKSMWLKWATKVDPEMIKQPSQPSLKSFLGIVLIEPQVTLFSAM